MLRTVRFACALHQAEADALNAESGRVYAGMLARHYRVYRKQSLWLAPASGEQLEDALGARPPCMPTAATLPSKASTRHVRPPKPARQRAWTPSTPPIASAGAPPSGKRAASAGTMEHCSWPARAGWRR